MNNYYSKIRVGIIGAGGVSLHSHLPVLTNMDKIRVEWICDKDLQKAQDLSKKFHVKSCFSDLRKCPDVDAVLIAIPVGFRREIMFKVLEKGWNAFCEKPFAMNIYEFDKYTERANKKKIDLGVALVRRYAKTTIMAKNLITRGILGPINRVHASEGNRIKRTGQGDGWYMANPSIVGGGVLMETGTHLIDQVLWILGVSKYSIKSCQQKKYEGMDFSSYIDAELIIDKDRAIDCKIEVSQIEDLCNGIFIEFSDYILKVGLFFEDTLEVLSRDGDHICNIELEDGAETTIQGFFLEWRDFLLQCETGIETGVSVETTRDTSEFIETCYKIAN